LKAGAKKREDDKRRRASVVAEASSVAKADAKENEDDGTDS
jgi:hypothetical protein